MQTQTIMLNNNFPKEMFYTGHIKNRPVKTLKNNIIVGLNNVDTISKFKIILNNTRNKISNRTATIIHTLYNTAFDRYVIEFSEDGFNEFTKLLKNIKLEDFDQEVTQQDIKQFNEIRSLIKNNFIYKGLIVSKSNIVFSKELQPINIINPEISVENAIRYWKCFNDLDYIQLIVYEMAIIHL